jgi:hypothetical protein
MNILVKLAFWKAVVYEKYYNFGFSINMQNLNVNI